MTNNLISTPELAISDLNPGKLYQCRNRRGLFKLVFYQKNTVWTASHIVEIAPYTPFIFLQFEIRTKKHLKIITLNRLFDNICIHPKDSEFDIEEIL